MTSTPFEPELPDPETSRFERDDHEVLLYRWPKPGAPRLLLVHGIGMGHRTFDRFIEALLPHAEVIAVDLPGFGDSPEPQRALSMRGTAELLAEAVLDIGLDPVVAVGHSMGAQVVVELAAAHPGLVDRVVCFAPAVNAAERTVPRQALRMLQDLFEGKPPIAIARGVIEYCKAGPRWFVKKLAPTLEHRIEDRLPEVRQPALVLCGSRDRVTPPEWCLAVARILPRGEFGVLHGPGHEAMIAQGDEAAECVLRWLGRCALPQPARSRR